MRSRPYCTPGLRVYQRVMEKTASSGSAIKRLRELVHAHDGVTVLCAHDVRELENLSARSSHRVAPIVQRDGRR